MLAQHQSGKGSDTHVWYEILLSSIESMLALDHLDYLALDQQIT